MVRQPSLILITVFLGHFGYGVYSAYQFSATQNPKSKAIVINNGEEQKFKPSSVLSYEARPLSFKLPNPWCQAREANGSIAKILGGAFWKLNDPPVKYSPVLELPAQRMELQRELTYINETGEYRCDLYNNMNITNYYASGEFNITVRPVFYFNHTSHGYKVSDKDNTTVIADRVTISKGDTTILRCRAIANPPPEFRWYKNTDDEDGRKAIESNPNIIQHPDHSLEIQNASTDHSGTYYCVVNNTMVIDNKEVIKTATVLYEVYVKGPLQWIIPLVIILIMAILLFAIIYGCGFIKRCRSYNVEKREKRQTKTTDPHAASGDIRSQEPMLKHERDT